MTTERDLSTLSYNELTEEIERLRKDNAQLAREHATMLSNLSYTQKRCTELSTASFDRYQAEARATSSHKGHVYNDLRTTGARDRLAMAALGLSGEAGETTDYIKKVLFHGHELSRSLVIKELGDVLWYIAEMASALDVKMNVIANKNIAKLRKRYPDGFSAEASINRREHRLTVATDED